MGLKNNCEKTDEGHRAESCIEKEHAVSYTYDGKMIVISKQKDDISTRLFVIKDREKKNITHNEARS